ncbi:MAG: AMP-binding protein [Candidatus Thioglobus sp.]|nr:AMP-binding protein [Candidatus Thioglobus sp.]
MHIAAVVAAFGAVFTLYKLPQSLARYFVKFVLSFKYRVEVDGLENIPNDKGVLLLGNHISYLDWAILQISYPKQIRFVMEKNIYKKWYWKWFLDLFKVIPISKVSSKNALLQVSQALNDGHTVVLFPEGCLSRNGQINPFLKGYELAIANTKNTVIVPFYLHGLWESRFSLAANKVQNEAGKISVRFGKALNSATKTQELEAKVLDLSLDTWEQNISNYKSISHTWLRRIKFEKGFFIADSTGANLSNSKFLSEVLMMRIWLGKNLKNQRHIGLILPSSVTGAMANMALFTLGKVVINLNYTDNLALNIALEKADISTIISSRKFVQKLMDKGFEISHLLSSKNIIYLEDIRPFANKIRTFSYFLRAKLYPLWLLKLLFICKQNINDTAVISFSSGDKSPNGILLSHKNIIGNIKQIKQMLNPTDADVLIGSLPIFHSFGLTVCTLMPQLEGISVIYPDPADAFGIGKLVAKHQGTILLATATFLRLYAENKKCQPLMFSTLNKVIAGAEKLPAEVREMFKQKFGLDIFAGYGVTETSPGASCNVPDQLIPQFWKLQLGNQIGTVGRALAGTKIIIADPDTLKPLPLGAEGLILISGVQVMSGYLQDRQKTQQSLTTIDNRRFYITGDKGKISPAGFISIIDKS